LRGGGNLQLEDNASDVLGPFLVLEGRESDLEETLETRFGQGRAGGFEDAVEALTRPQGDEISVPQPETGSETGTRDWFEVANLHSAILRHFCNGIAQVLQLLRVLRNFNRPGRFLGGATLDLSCCIHDVRKRHA
jgi:hypothetical protein